MALYVNTNISSINAQRKLTNATNSLNVSYQRLASGLRINSSKDDAAGLQISNRLTAQINGLHQGNRNANDGIALAQTIEGAMDETTNMLQRIRTLAIQAANGTNTPEDRQALQREVESLSLEITRIARKTTFAGAEILDGVSYTKANNPAPTPPGPPGKAAKAGITVNFTEKMYTKENASPWGMLPVTGKIDFQVGANHHDLITLGGLSAGITMSGIALAIMKTVDVPDPTPPAPGPGGDPGGAAPGADGKAGTPRATADQALAFIVNGAYGGTSTDADKTKIINEYGLKYSTDVNKGGNDPYLMWSVSTADAAQATLKTIDEFIAHVDSARANLGAIQNRMEATIRNQSSIAENEADARSRIRDTDFANETANLTANNIIQQASQTILAQANQRPTVALSLLGR